MRNLNARVYLLIDVPSTALPICVSINRLQIFSRSSNSSSEYHSMCTWGTYGKLRLWIGVGWIRVLGRLESLEWALSVESSGARCVYACDCFEHTCCRRLGHPHVCSRLSASVRSGKVLARRAGNNFLGKTRLAGMAASLNDMKASLND